MYHYHVLIYLYSPIHMARGQINYSELIYYKEELRNRPFTKPENEIVKHILFSVPSSTLRIYDQYITEENERDLGDEPLLDYYDIQNVFGFVKMQYPPPKTIEPALGNNFKYKTVIQCFCKNNNNPKYNNKSELNNKIREFISKRNPINYQQFIDAISRLENYLRPLCEAGNPCC
eukprot:450141_1